MFATRIIKISATVLALALFVSCGKKEEPGTAVPPPAATATPAPQTPSAPPPVAAPAPQTAAPAAGGPVLARSDGEKPGVSVEVTELKRSSGGTVTLKFAMVNNTKEEIRLGSNYGAGGGNVDDYTVSGTHLIDAVNKKKYLVVRDSERNCVCSRVESGIPVGERMNLWAKFPAPPEDVKVVSVMILHFAPMDDVPISP
jgi:hypothetical protein